MLTESVLIAWAMCACNTLVAGVIRPSSSLNVMAGEGFVAYLDAPKSFGQIKNCWFKFRGEEKVSVILNSTDPIETDRGEQILPFNKNICGIRVKDVSAASAAIWTLEAENNNGDYNHDAITIQILPTQRTNFDTRVKMEIGMGTVRCSKLPPYTKHCKIVDMYYGGTYHQCELYTSIHPSSLFDCYMFNWGRMERSHERIYVDIQNTTLYTNATTIENPSSTVLHCELQEKVFSCQAELPDRTTELLIMDGVYNGYYSALDTMTSMSKCVLEIPKPYNDAEIGMWRILNYESTTPSGCIFYVGKSKRDIILSELSKLAQLTTLNVYEPEGTSDREIEELSCSVPFVINDCYLRDPNNTIYFPDSKKFELQRLYGKCTFFNMPVIPGVWACGARGRDYDKEVVQNIEVIVKSKYGETLTSEVKTRRGDTVELMCKSPFEEPISHCAFVGPKGDVYLVGTVNSIKSKGHVQYYGRGINKGECGLKINDVNRDDYGQWKCQFTIYAGKVQSSFIMELKELDTLTTSLGLGTGLTVMIVLIMGVVVGTVFYRRRNMSACHNFESADPIEIPERATTPAGN